MIKIVLKKIRRNKIEKNNQLKLIKENFPEEILNMLCKIGSIGDRMKCSVFMVGGVVRDSFFRN